MPIQNAGSDAPASMIHQHHRPKLEANIDSALLLADGEVA
jgi:hypothetical protein